MRKQITAIILLAGTIVSFGQTSTEQYNTYSPYSIFGVGQKRFNGTSETQSMAGIGIAYTPGRCYECGKPRFPYGNKADGIYAGCYIRGDKL